MAQEFNEVRKQETDYTNTTDVTGDLSIVDNDKLGILYVTTGSSDVTITLTATEDKREITIKKVDEGSGDIVFVGTIDGDTSKKISSKNTAIKIQYNTNASEWRII